MKARFFLLPFLLFSTAVHADSAAIGIGLSDCVKHHVNSQGAGHEDWNSAVSDWAGGFLTGLNVAVMASKSGEPADLAPMQADDDSLNKVIDQYCDTHPDGTVFDAMYGEYLKLKGPAK